MGYKIIGSNGSKYYKESPQDAAEESRVYDHYDYAFDEFETYDEDNFESEESCVCEIKEDDVARVSNEVLSNKDLEVEQLYTRWERAKLEETLRETSNVWFSQAPFDLQPDQNNVDWKSTQTSPDTYVKSTSSQTHQVAQVTVASMAPDDLTTPDRVRFNHSFIMPYSTFKSTAQESQLMSFLTFAAHVLESLMARPGQQASTRLCDVVDENSSSDRLTAGSKTLVHTDEFLVGRAVHFIAFKEQSSTTFLCCFGPGPSSSTYEYAHQGCICIFDILLEPSLQFRLLVQGVPLCASWSINARRWNWGVIVAGTEDGSLALWDLSSKFVGTSSPPCTLQPTFSTNYRIKDNHTAPIHRVVLDGSSCKEVALDSFGSAGGLTRNFLQLLSIDRLGFVHMWTVKELQVQAARDDELGLHPDGRLYLVRTGRTSVLPRTVDALEIALPEACTFAVIPGRAREILVAMSDGGLVKKSLVDSRPSAPGRYMRGSLNGSKPVASPVLSLSFSPFAEDCFLVAYGDSTVAVFLMEKSYPLAIWTLPSTESCGHLISAHWSPSESTVFLVALSSGIVHVFDMSRGLSNPKFTENLDLDRNIVCFELSKPDAGDIQNADREFSFMTATTIGNIRVHLLKSLSTTNSPESLKNVLLASIDMI